MDAQALQAKLDGLMQDFERMRRGAGELQRQLQALRVTATSDDGFVKATVGPRGQLIELEIDPRIYRRPDSKQLAATITSTVQRAATEVADKVAALCKPHLPEEQLRPNMNMDLEGIFTRLDSALTPGGDLR